MIIIIALISVRFKIEGNFTPLMCAIVKFVLYYIEALAQSLRW